jgi:hypothetical protein
MDEPTPTLDALSKPPQRFRRTRIAVLVFFGVLTVALCVLWVRSYWWCDVCFGPKVKISDSIMFEYDASSEYGGISLRRLNIYADDDLEKPYFASYELAKFTDGPNEESNWDCSADSDGNLWLSAPHWFWALTTATVGILPWARVRFSLRTMLIATTLVAVALGLGVWMAR